MCHSLSRNALILCLWYLASRDLKYTKDWDKQILCNNPFSTEHLIWERLPLKSCFCQIIISSVIFDLHPFQWQGFGCKHNTSNNTIPTKCLWNPAWLSSHRNLCGTVLFGFSVFSLTFRNNRGRTICGYWEIRLLFQTSFPRYSWS